MEQMDALAKWTTIVDKPDLNPCSQLIPNKTRERIRKMHSDCVVAIATLLARGTTSDDGLSDAIVKLTSGLYAEILEIERIPLVSVATSLYEQHPNQPDAQASAILELADYFRKDATSGPAVAPVSPSSARRSSSERLGVACASVRRSVAELWAMGMTGLTWVPPTVKVGVVFGLPGAVTYQAARFDGVTVNSAVSALVCAGSVSWGLVVNPPLRNLIRMWNEFLQHDLGWYDVLANKRHMYALYEVLWGLFPTRQLAADLRLIGRHLLIPGFHAFALALQGLMDVYESGGDVLHYLWFDVVLAHVSRLFLFSHAFLRASWDKITEYVTILTETAEKATTWVMKKARLTLDFVASGLADGLTRANQALQGMVSGRVGDAEQIQLDAEYIQEELEAYEESGDFVRELTFEETVELARARRAPPTRVLPRPPPRAWWKHLTHALISLAPRLSFDTPRPRMDGEDSRAVEHRLARGGAVSAVSPRRQYRRRRGGSVGGGSVGGLAPTHK
jgi:hypothetical protein